MSTRTLALLVLLAALPACKKKNSTRSPDAAPAAIAEFPLGESQYFEDEESLFRVELPGTPIESEETDDDPNSLVVRHSAQFRDGDSELLLMWNEVLEPPTEPADKFALLAEVAAGWTDSGLKIHEQPPTEMGGCAAREIRGRLEKQPVEGRLAICDDTLIQIVASGTYVDDAPRVFDSFVWLR